MIFFEFWILHQKQVSRSHAKLHWISIDFRWFSLIFQWFSYISSLRGAMNALKIMIFHWFYCISSPGGPCKLIEVTIFQLISIAFHWFPFDFLLVPIEFHWFPFFRGSRKDRVSKIGSCVTWNSQGKATDHQPADMYGFHVFSTILGLKATIFSRF